MVMMILKCTSCGVVQRTALGPTGTVREVGFEHEGSCPFYLAVQRGELYTGVWVGEHGSPMTVERAS